MVVVPRPKDPWRLTLEDMADLLGLSQRRASAVGKQLPGLSEDDARDLAAQSGCHLRVTRRDGRSLPMTLKYDAHCIDVAIADGVVVYASPGGSASIRDA
jgi:hypothetical protein